MSVFFKDIIKQNFNVRKAFYEIYYRYITAIQ